MLFKFLFVLTAFAVAVVQAAPPVCTATQLKGTFGSFRLPGGGGAYSPGTQQVVSWSWPTGSNITTIKAVSICQGTNCVAPISVSGIPVNFTPTQPDQGGAIPVTLPFSLVPGSYVFRVTVTSSGNDCTVDSAVFTIISGNTNGNQCNIGDSLCFNSSFIAPCIAVGGGTSPNIFAFGRATQCPGNCIQNGNKASCVLVNPPPQPCTPGFMKCVSATGFQVCTQTGVTTTAFGPTMQCAPGTSCASFLTNYIICK